jgi:hypothetical protein
MKRFENSPVFLSLMFFTCAASADAALLECSTYPSILMDGLGRATCEIFQSVKIERYFGPMPASPYANNFDRREVAIALGENAETVREITGAKTKAGTAHLQASFFQPPFSDQIFKRHSISKPSRYKHWAIAYEHIEYAAQGSSRGFVLECATAIHFPTRTMKIVAECFPWEERVRFSRTLDAVR